MTKWEIGDDNDELENRTCRASTNRSPENVGTLAWLGENDRGLCRSNPRGGIPPLIPAVDWHTKLGLFLASYSLSEFSTPTRYTYPWSSRDGGCWLMKIFIVRPCNFEEEVPEYKIMICFTAQHAKIQDGSTLFQSLKIINSKSTFLTMIFEHCNLQSEHYIMYFFYVYFLSP